MASRIPLLLCHKFISLFHSLSLSLIFPLFSFISAYIFSFVKKNDKVETESQLLLPDYTAVIEDTEFTEFTEYEFINSDDEEEEEKTETESKTETELFLKFKFPSFEAFNEYQNGQGVTEFNYEFAPSPSSSKNDFFKSEKSFIATFIDELDSGKGKEIQVFSEEEIQKMSESDGNQESLAESGFSEKNFLVNESENSLVDSCSDGFLSDGDFGEESDLDEVDEKMEDESTANSFDVDEESEVMEELIVLEEQSLQSPDELHWNFLSEKDFINKKHDATEQDDKETKRNDGTDSDCDDSNKLESLWEHQELIEQLRMELKKVRATGLPTILEESESPKIMDDLKPWKIDEQQDWLGEIHKFYKSYREKMRKFDILNYQKMYAMGFLQLKDPLMSNQKPEPPTLRSLVSQNLFLFKHKVHGSDPMKKLIKELEGDLEVVYVGHMCLSWEFLYWQHEKALDLWDSDPRGILGYNEVAGEFQQFQVLMQRFIEDEPFQGPRVQNYVKTRCVLRNLLQVPVIRDDNLKDRRKASKKDLDDEYVITSDMLVDIVEESIRIFWRFIRADKDCSSSLAINGHKKRAEIYSPDELKLLVEVRKNLQKKEKKLKDVLRSENCILRKFRSRRDRDEDSDDQVLYFFAQVDMKLVSRVLNMSKITKDQLLWCHKKLSRMSFKDRKIYVEPDFLLFPC